MSFESLMVQPLVLYNRVAGPTDPGFSDEEITFDAGVPMKGWVAPATVTEALTDRDTRLSMFQVFLPPTTPVDALSRIEYAGMTMEVVGKPRLFYRGAHGAHHLELMMQVIEG